MPLSPVLGRPFGEIPWSMLDQFVGRFEPSRLIGRPFERIPWTTLPVPGHPTGEDAKFVQDYLGLEPHEFRGSVDHGPAGADVHGTIIKRGIPVGTISRNFDIPSARAWHQYFELKKPFQGWGIGKDILRSNIEHYQKAGIKEVHLTANVDVGGYAWAKYGFVPKNSWHGLRNWMRGDLERLVSDGRLPKDVYERVSRILDSDDPKTIWKIADIEYPVGNKSLGKGLLLGHNWFGKLDLTDPAAMERFNAYVGGKPN